ncbi:hypothetical protein HLRTI_000449 [Halorhabdus tiamatea SARL4B]|uniref:Uncharacterized protein n=2 Tax=Halorhabdus TaxID=146825 RepID=U2DP35_9EURY|nr:hypothetical protein HLRTI_000449 [Halorhabdus tiamatea SARL4B]
MNTTITRMFKYEGRSNMAMTEDNPPTVQSALLKKRQNNQYEIALSNELTSFHDFPTTVSYSITPKWVNAGRDTNLVYEVRGGEVEGVSRYAPQSGNKKILRFPKDLVAERGLSDDEHQVSLFSPEEGCLQIVVPESFEQISKFEPIDNVVSREEIPTKQSGKDRQYEQYRLFLPTKFNNLYQDLPPVNQWSIGIAGGEPTLIAEFVDEETAASTAALTSKWHSKQSGDTDHQVKQISIYPPKALISALGWDSLPIGLVPEENRILIVPDPQGTSVGLRG